MKSDAMKQKIERLRYDAGLLNDFGGGNVEWWQDYIRAELDRAHDFYSSLIEGYEAQLDERTAERDSAEQFNGECEARAEAAERALEEAVEVLRPFADLDHEEEAAASLLGARDGNAAVRVPRRHLRQARAFLTKRGEK